LRFVHRSVPFWANFGANVRNRVRPGDAPLYATATSGSTSEVPLDFVFNMGFFAAAFVPSFLVSRIIFRLTKKWEGTLVRLIATNIASGIICIVVFVTAGVWFAGGFDFPWLFGVVNYAVAQAIWLAVDIYSDWINGRLERQNEMT